MPYHDYLQHSSGSMLAAHMPSMSASWLAFASPLPMLLSLCVWLSFWLWLLLCVLFVSSPPHTRLPLYLVLVLAVAPLHQLFAPGRTSQ